MAGKKLRYNTVINASTILEVIISMVIIIVVFGIAMMIYANIMQSSLSVKKMYAEAILKKQLILAEKDSANMSNASIVIDDFRIEQQATTYDGNNDLIEIQLSAYDNNQNKVAELNKILYIR